MRKLTFEEFLERARQVHGDAYTYDEETFSSTKKKMWMTHVKCGHRFQQTPHNHLHGQGCPICRYTDKKTDYSFEKEAVKRFGKRYSFPYIDKEYENSHSKITIVCNRCGNTFIKRANDFITSQYGGCKCEKEQDKYIVYEELTKLYNKNEIIPFEGYKHKTKDKVQLVCKKHGIYEKYVNDLFNGNDTCQKCSRSHNGDSKKLSFEEIKQRIKEKYPSVSIIESEEYSSTSSKLTFKCNDCGNTFRRTAGGFLYGKLYDACPHCSKLATTQNRVKTQGQFEDETKRMYGDLYTVVGEYKSSDEKILIRCNDCGKEFEIEANSFLQGHGCPYHNFNSSINEQKIYEYVKKCFPSTIANDRKTLNGYELDIYIPEKMIAIEYDGLYWHCELKKDNSYHLKKTEECERQGIRLIHIFEDEWLDKSKIWLSMLNNLLGLTKNKIYARKCLIKDVETNECTVFLKQNHIQGWCPSQIKLGLYYNDELVSVMTFGKSRHFIGNGQTEYELLRFCNKLNTNVVGSASKLFKFFVEKYKPKSIVSYADRRWSVGNLYDVLGFDFIHNSKPNYYYVIGAARKNRFNFRKSVLVKKYNCPSDISEREFCKQQKWYRIYDCGTKVYKWKK